MVRITSGSRPEQGDADQRARDRAEPADHDHREQQHDLVEAEHVRIHDDWNSVYMPPATPA